MNKKKDQNTMDYKNVNEDTVGNMKAGYSSITKDKNEDITFDYVN
jgi:hypothetical protein